MKALVVPADFPSETATELALANGCAGFYSGLPPKWVALSEAQGWTLPCVVETDEYDTVLSWTPVA
tara:strand:+ start:1636 stop:1833 length:198 start_codon:yes stop_codon:yes gene_type:complete